MTSSFFPTHHDRRRHALWIHFAAAVLVSAALGRGLYVTRNHEWPSGADTLRDIAAAETIRASVGASIRHRTLLPDPYYKDEVFWYSPLMPSVMTIWAAMSGEPIQVAATRGAVYWNLAGPIAFYLLGVALFGPLAAFAALAILLYVEPFSSWQAATYSPALITSSFAQPFVYAGLYAWLRFRRSEAWTPAVICGCLLGLSFLAHTAAAAVFALTIALDAALCIRSVKNAGGGG